MKSLAIALLVVTTATAGGAAFVALERSDATKHQLAVQQRTLDELKETAERLEEQLLAARERNTEAARWVVDGNTDATKNKGAAGSREEMTTEFEEDLVDSAQQTPEDRVREEAIAHLDDTEGTPVSKDTMRALLAEIRDEEEQEERSRRREQRMERIKSRVESMAERLHLQPSQEEEMVVIMTESMEKRSALFQQVREGTMERRDVRSAMADQRAATDEQVQLVLTSDQYEEYQKIQEEERAQRGDRRGGRWGSSAPATESAPANNNGQNNDSSAKSGRGS